MLASEMALATDAEVIEAQQTIDSALRVAITGEVEEPVGRRAGISATTKLNPVLLRLLNRVG